MSKVARFYPIWVMKSASRLLIILAFFSISWIAGAEEYSEEERLLGFTQHYRRNAEIDRERQSGADEVKKKKARWEEELRDSVGEYKDWKSRQAAPLDESSAEYKQDRAFKKEQNHDLEEARVAYIKNRDRERAKRKVTVKLTEEHEYGLDEIVDRVEFRKRALFHSGKDSGRGGRGGRGSSIGSGSGGGSGSTDFGAPTPPADFNPPVSAAPPPAPEFFEPEIPPPPPPSEFDESIPPPIFDDPEF